MSKPVPDQFTLYKSPIFFTLTTVGSLGTTIGVVLNSIGYTIIGPWLSVFGLISFGILLTQIFGSIGVSKHKIVYKRILLWTASVEVDSIRSVTVNRNGCIRYLHTDGGIIKLPSHRDADGYFMRYALEHKWLQYNILEKGGYLSDGV